MTISLAKIIGNLAAEAGLQASGIAPATEEVTAEYPWARSVVTAAVCYLPPEAGPEDGAPRGWVARVARSSDYHDVLRSKLEPIAGMLRHNGVRAVVCVDTSPIPERKLAVLGGIAWRGRSGNVFVENCGSFAALGEVVTDADLPVSEPLNEDRCGECRRCVDACPAKALDSSGAVEVSKCLSAVTQMSGIIPREMRALMGNRIYGCDACQEVCPQNRNVRPSCPEFAANIFPGARPELIPLIDLSAEDFKKKIRQSSIGWIRRTRIRRNAATAAGNLRCAEAVPALSRTLKDENPVLRTHAAWALGTIGTEDALAAIRGALPAETDPDAAAEMREWV